MDEIFEALVREGMARMRWSRKRAEQAARRYLRRADSGSADKARRMLGLVNQSAPKPRAKPTRNVRLVKAEEALALTPKPMNLEELLALNAAAKARRKATAKARRKVTATQRTKAKMPKLPKPPNAKKPKATKAKRPELVGDLAESSKPRRVKKKKRPLTPLQRLERRLGPDDGRRRGGTPFLQGGSPGLGRRS